jgi:stage II sporulation protein M
MGKIVPGPRDFIKYVHSIRLFIGVVVLLFLVSMALGYVIPLLAPQLSGTLIAGLDEKAKALASQPPLIMMLGIFSNNAMGSIMALVFGLAAGIFPLFFMISNGMVIGILLELIIAKMGVVGGTTFFLAGVLPHGIFELPAVFISAAIGLKLGYEALRSLVLKKDVVTPEIVRGLTIYVFWILPILFLAAMVETFVTGAILAHFAHAPIFV